MALQDARVPRPRENSRQVRERFAEGFASILVLDPPCRPLADSLCSRRLTFSQARKRSRGSTSSKGLGLREVSMEGYDKRTNKCSRVGICRCIYHVILLLSFHWSNFESQAKYLAITSVSILRQ